MPFSEQLPTGSMISQFGAYPCPCTLSTVHSIKQTSRVSLSCDGNYTVVILLIFTIKMFRMRSFFLKLSVYE
jgi:hypothetical protein